DLAELQHRIDVNTLRARLLQAERQLQALVDDPTKTVDPKGEQPASKPPTAAPDLPRLPEVQELLAATRNVLNEMKGSVDRARASTETPSPEDTFHALQAYRSEIQGEIAATTLDNKHDSAGNTLYRLQFRATISPPNQAQDRARWGLSRFQVLPPRL